MKDHANIVAARPVSWSVQSWQRFWAAPDPEVARARVPTIVTPDVVGYWPFATKTASGTIGYRDRILALLALVPVLWRIAAIVHEADLDDQRYDAPEAPGLDMTLRVLSMTCGDDDILHITGPVFDGIYEYCKRAILLGREPA